MNPNARRWLYATLMAAAALAVMVLPMGCASAPDPKPPAREIPLAWEPVREPEPAAAPSLEPIYFDTDSAELAPRARASLESVAVAIRENPEWGDIAIEGHCDERGSASYNLNLGKRRADTVKRYLVQWGVAPSRLLTRSFGEQRPAARGHGEAAWSLNRRSELRIGAIPLASL